VLQELQPGDPRLIGPYRVVGLLGDGGMGRVFLGRSAGGRPVALKVIRRDLAADPDFRQRFRREVAAARKVSGLYTAMVIDADVDAPEPWLATAYVEGPSLYEAVNDHGPLPLGSVLALAGGLAESLTAIHAAGVVHRDLKPSNVLLGRDGPYLIDFGISRAAESTSLTRAGFVIGSPGFMSPEQAEGGEVGPASDIFSLGAVLAFAASGQHPFGAGSTAALMTGGVWSTLTPLKVVVRELSAMSVAVPVVDWFAPSLVNVCEPGHVATPESASEHAHDKLTGALYHPFALAGGTTPLIDGGVLSTSSVRDAVAELPALSSAVPEMTWPAPSVVTLTGAVHDATPDVESAHVKVTVASVLFQPFAFGAGDCDTEIDGAVLSSFTVAV